MTIIVSLNGLDFDIGTRGERGWQDLTNWVLEANSLLESTSSNSIIPASTTNLQDGVAVSLYTINTPNTNQNIIIEFGVYRRTLNTGATVVSSTGQISLAYIPAGPDAGTWSIVTTANADPKVTFDVTSNVLRATASVLTGDADTSRIVYSGRIIKV